jgi:hypothetical protein
MLEVSEQPEAVPVTVYLMVEVGVAVTLAVLIALKPIFGAHE